MDARRIPFENEFDVIGAFDVLEHIKEDEEVLHQIYQAVRPGGGLILTVPQHPFLWSRQDDYACHVRRYSARELKDKVKRTGFAMVKMTSFVSLLLPIMILARVQKRNPALEYDPLSELKINPVLNTLFEKILDVERWMIFSGLSFPAGGSLLVIAHKVSGSIP
jgi:SAM-dependent methyltransferase